MTLKSSRLEKRLGRKMEGDDDGALEAFSLSLGFVASMVAKAVCELEVPDILAAADEPLSALQILQRLRHPLALALARPLPHAAALLDRMMRCLCAFNLFNAHLPAAAQVVDGGLLGRHAADEENLEGHVPKANVEDVSERHVEVTDLPAAAPTKYSVTPVSKWLQRGATLRGFLLFETSSPMQAPWQHLSHTLLHHGSAPFTATHSTDVWGLAAADPPFNCLLNAAMASASHLASVALLQHYRGFEDRALTLVDVGGGTGTIASSIVSRYPSIRAINFDLPHVIATAPIYQGVEHIAGDMFKIIPKGDAIFLKVVPWLEKNALAIIDMSVDLIELILERTFMTKYSNRIFKSRLHISRSTYYVSVASLGCIYKDDTNFRTTVTVYKRVATTLHRLASETNLQIDLYGISIHKSYLSLHQVAIFNAKVFTH